MCYLAIRYIGAIRKIKCNEKIKFKIDLLFFLTSRTFNEFQAHTFYIPKINYTTRHTYTRTSFHRVIS